MASGWGFFGGLGQGLASSIENQRNRDHERKMLEERQRLLLEAEKAKFGLEQEAQRANMQMMAQQLGVSLPGMGMPSAAPGAAPAGGGSGPLGVRYPSAAPAAPSGGAAGPGMFDPRMLMLAQAMMGNKSPGADIYESLLQYGPGGYMDTANRRGEQRLTRQGLMDRGFGYGVTPEVGAVAPAVRQAMDADKALQLEREANRALRFSQKATEDQTRPGAVNLINEQARGAAQDTRWKTYRADAAGGTVDSKVSEAEARARRATALADQAEGGTDAEIQYKQDRARKAQLEAEMAAVSLGVDEQSAAYEIGKRRAEYQQVAQRVALADKTNPLIVKKYEAELQGLQADTDVKVRTADDRVAEQAADTSRAQADAAVAQGTAGARISQAGSAATEAAANARTAESKAYVQESSADDQIRLYNARVESEFAKVASQEALTRLREAQTAKTDQEAHFQLQRGMKELEMMDTQLQGEEKKQALTQKRMDLLDAYMLTSTAREGYLKALRDKTVAAMSTVGNDKAKLSSLNQALSMIAKGTEKNNKRLVQRGVSLLNALGPGVPNVTYNEGGFFKEGSLEFTPGTGTATTDQGEQVKLEDMY